MNEQTERNRTKFDNLTAPFAGAWRSVQYAILGGQVGTEWVLIAARCVLSAAPPTAERRLTHLLPDVALATGAVPADRWEDLVTSIVEYELVPQWLVMPTAEGTPYEFQLRFPDQGWQDARQLRAVTAAAYGLTLPCIVFERGAGRLAEVFRPFLLQEVDAKLPLRLPEFKNLDHLFREVLPGFHTNNNMLPTQTVHLLAELPFELAYWNDDQVLTVRAPQSAFQQKLQVITHTGMTHQVYVPTGVQKLDEHWSGWRIPITWPAGERRATAKLYADDAYLDEFDFQCWTDTLSVRAAADAHFDPEHLKLRAALLSTDNHDNEYGVVRLLNLLGIPAVWYGHGYDRSDAMAVFEEWEGRTIALLIEVTRQKPSNKFTPLLGRAQAFREALKGQAEVLPMVVVTSEASSADFQQAHMDGILLCDSKTLGQLLDLLRSDPTPRDVMQVLRSIRFPVPQNNAMVRW